MILRGIANSPIDSGILVAVPLGKVNAAHTIGLRDTFAKEVGKD
jgi:hypothetical protein